MGFDAISGTVPARDKYGRVTAQGLKDGDEKFKSFGFGRWVVLGFNTETQLYRITSDYGDGYGKTAEHSSVRAARSSFHHACEDMAAWLSRKGSDGE